MSRKHLGPVRQSAQRRLAEECPDGDGCDIQLLGEPAWAAASAGDAAAAVGAALRAAYDPGCGAARRAITLAALEACADAGDAAARLVLDHLRRRSL